MRTTSNLGGDQEAQVRVEEIVLLEKVGQENCHIPPVGTTETILQETK